MAKTKVQPPIGMEQRGTDGEGKDPSHAATPVRSGLIGSPRGRGRGHFCQLSLWLGGDKVGVGLHKPGPLESEGM
jgi:hypothetical protein